MVPTEYTCRLCGSRNIVEISLVPRTYPMDPETGELATMGEDEAFWESETVLGYGCDTETCENWQGHWGNLKYEDGVFRADPAPTFEELTGG